MSKKSFNTSSSESSRKIEIFAIFLSKIIFVILDLLCYILQLIVDPLYFIARIQSYKIKLFQKDKIEFHSLFVTMRTITKQTSLKSCLLEEFMMNLVFFGRKIFYSIDKEGQI